MQVDIAPDRNVARTSLKNVLASEARRRSAPSVARSTCLFRQRRWAASNTAWPCLATQAEPRRVRLPFFATLRSFNSSPRLRPLPAKLLRQDSPCLPSKARPSLHPARLRHPQYNPRRHRAEIAYRTDLPSRADLGSSSILVRVPAAPKSPEQCLSTLRTWEIRHHRTINKLPLLGSLAAADTGKIELWI